MEDILIDLQTYLSALDSDLEVSDGILTLLINNSIRKVCRTRYGDTYDDMQKEKAITDYRDIIYELSLFAFLHMGSEFETSHEANGSVENYIEEKELLKGIIPLARVL